jgi:hypothetical protein
MPKINLSHLQRVLQFQAEQRRGRLAIIALLHARVAQLCGLNRISRALNQILFKVELAILFCLAFRFIWGPKHARNRCRSRRSMKPHRGQSPQPHGFAG